MEDRGQAYRMLMRRFPTGVTVVTTKAGPIHHGMTANSVTTLSLDPPLLLVCVWKQARAHDLMLGSGQFCVNVLAADQADVSKVFADPKLSDDERWAAVASHEGTEGARHIDGCLSYLDCRITDTYAGGTHTIVVGEVVEMKAGADKAPLIFHGGRYRRLGPDD